MACQKTFTPDDALDSGHPAAARFARPADLPALVELDRVCFAARAWSRAAWREVVTEPEWTVVVIARGNLVVAASVLLPAAPVTHLASLAVHPRWRRRGVGRELLGDAIARARAASARWLALEVDRDNTGAISLYRRDGFAVARRFLEDGRWRQEMVRRLGGRDGV